MRHRFINAQTALELVCFLAFSGMLVYLVISENYRFYVAPRMRPYLLFSAAVLLLYAASCAVRLFRRQYRRRAAHCFVLVIPLLLLLIPHGQISTVDNGGILTGSSLSGLSGQAAAVSSAPAPDLSAASSSVSADTAISQTSSGDTSADSGETGGVKNPPDSSDGYLVKDDSGQVIEEIHGYREEQKTIAISNDEFYAWCLEFNLYPDRFVGYQVTVTGYVLKDIPALSANEFVPARLLMSCCAADLAPCGIVCEYDHVADLTSNAWVTVTGTLEEGEYEGNSEPQIHVTSISSAQEVDDYVYPY